jgi:transglutaminase-like putative cysteine protease
MPYRNYIFTILLFPLVLLLFPGFSFAKDRTVTVTIDFDLKVPREAKRVRLWVPYPMSDRNQNITDVRIDGNYRTESILREEKFGNNMLYAEWLGPVQSHKLSITFHAVTKKRVTKDCVGKQTALPTFELREYLQTELPPDADRKIKDLAANVAKGGKSIGEKARTIYDWITDNMYRNPEIKGCGFGEVEHILATRAGKCVDIHTVFVSVARAAGVPARISGIACSMEATALLAVLKSCLFRASFVLYHSLSRTSMASCWRFIVIFPLLDASVS